MPIEEHPDPLVAPVVGGTPEELIQRWRARAARLRENDHYVDDAMATEREECANELAVLVPRPEPPTDGIRFDAETNTYVARHTVLTAARTEEEAKLALASAIRLTADYWPPRPEPREPEPVVDWFSAKRAIQAGVSACQSVANERERSGRATSTPELIKSAEHHRASACVLEAYVRQVDAAVRPASALDSEDEGFRFPAPKQGKPIPGKLGERRERPPFHLDDDSDASAPSLEPQHDNRESRLGDYRPDTSRRAGDAHADAEKQVAASAPSRPLEDMATLARRASRIFEGFRLESMNGVICSIPDTGLDTPPHRTWCAPCQSRWRALKELADDLNARAEAFRRESPVVPGGDPQEK